MEEVTDPRVNVNSPNEEDPSMEEEEETDPRFKDKSPTKHVIPVAPYFQAEIPQYIGNYVSDPETEKFLGNTIWPIENLNLGQNPDDPIGNGRPDACTCTDPKTLRCVKTHVTQEKARLRDELGTAFHEWKLDEMGDDASLNWSSREIRTIEGIVNKVPTWKKKEFVKVALQALHPSKNRASIVNYLFDIVIPRKIGAKTRSGVRARDVCTDDELVSKSYKRATAALRGPEEKRRRLI